MRLNTMEKAEILAKLNAGVNGNRLAEEYGVAKSTISSLKKRKYDEMLQPSKRNGTFNQPSSASESDNESNQSNNASNEDEIGDERVEKKSHALPMFRQLKLYKPSIEMDENEHDDDDDVADEYEDDEEEEDDNEEDEEDFNEICRKLRRVCDNLSVTTQSLSEMLKLISKLRSGGYI